MTDRPSIVVAGAGAVGSTVAYVLARAGHAVTVVDPAPLGDNASGVAAGMLAPAFESLFDAQMAGRYALLAEARDLWPALAAEIGLPIGQDGAIATGSAREGAEWMAQLRAAGASAESADAAGGAAVFTPEDWRLAPRPALVALRSAAEARGARFETGRVEGPVRGALLVLATGAERALAAKVPELERLAPIKGHVLSAAGHFAAGPVRRAGGLYLCRGDGEAVLGATMEAGRGDRAVDPEVVAALLAAAAPLIGPLGPLPWRAAAGVRGATPDGLPLVGWSQAPGVILAVGARRNGWLLAPMMAATVLDVLEGRPGRQAALFDPARFGPVSTC